MAPGIDDTRGSVSKGTAMDPFSDATGAAFSIAPNGGDGADIRRRRDRAACSVEVQLARPNFARNTRTE